MAEDIEGDRWHLGILVSMCASHCVHKFHLMYDPNTVGSTILWLLVVACSAVILHVLLYLATSFTVCQVV